MKISNSHHRRIQTSAVMIAVRDTQRRERRKNKQSPYTRQYTTLLKCFERARGLDIITPQKYPISCFRGRLARREPASPTGIWRSNGYSIVMFFYPSSSDRTFFVLLQPKRKRVQRYWAPSQAYLMPGAAVARTSHQRPCYIHSLNGPPCSVVVSRC